MKDIFDKFDNFLRFILSLGMQYPRVFVFFFIALIAFFSIQLPKINITVSLHEIVDKKLPGAKRLEEMKSDFESGNSIFVVFRKDHEKLNEAELAKIDRRLSEYNIEEVEIYRITSPYLFRKPKREGNEIWFYKLIKDFKAESLRLLNESPWRDVYYNQDRGDYVVEIAYRDTIDGSRFGKFNPAPIGNLIDRLSIDFPSSENIKVDVLGSAAFSFYAFKGLKFNSSLNYVILFFLIFVIWFLFGRFRGGIIFISNLAVMGVCVYGLMGLLGIHIDILTSGVFLMLTVAGLEDFIFLSNVRQKYGNDWAAAFNEISIPSFYTSLTTIFGFGSLYLSDVEIIQNFSIVASFGAFVEWVTMFLFTPALLSIFPYFRDWVSERKQVALSMITKVTTLRLSKIAGACLLVFYLLGVVGVTRLNGVDSPKNMFSSAHPFSIGNDYLNSSRGWEGSISLVFENKNTREFNETVLRNVATIPVVKTIYNPYEGIDYLVKGLNPLDEKMMRRDFKRTEMYKKNFSEDNKVRSIIYVKNSYSDNLNELVSGINRLCENGKYCHAAGELVSYCEFTNAVMGTLYRSLGSSLFLVSIVVSFLCFRFGQGKNFLKLILGSFWGPFFMITILWVFQVRINFMTCVFASVLVGLTGDNAIQFLFSGHDDLKSGIMRHAPASIMIALTMTVASLFFVISAFVPPRFFGILLGIGIIASLLGDIWIVDSLVRNKDD